MTRGARPRGRRPSPPPARASPSRRGSRWRRSRSRRLPAPARRGTGWRALRSCARMVWTPISFEQLQRGLGADRAEPRGRGVEAARAVAEPQWRAEPVLERVGGREPARLVRGHARLAAPRSVRGTPCRVGTSATCRRRRRPRRSATRRVAASRPLGGVDTSARRGGARRPPRVEPATSPVEDWAATVITSRAASIASRQLPGGTTSTVTPRSAWARNGNSTRRTPVGASTRAPSGSAAATCATRPETSRRPRPARRRPGRASRTGAVRGPYRRPVLPADLPRAPILLRRRSASQTSGSGGKPEARGVEVDGLGARQIRNRQ